MLQTVPLPVPKEVLAAARDFMHARTIAFWGDHPELTKGEPTQYGSGVLLQIADTHFIVTAQHVSEMFVAEGWSAYIAARTDRFIPIKASLRMSKRADVALMRLDDRVVADLDGSGRRYTRMSEVEAHDPTDEAGGFYCAYGYPSVHSSTDHTAKLHTMTAVDCWGFPYSKEKEPIDGYDPALHISIAFDRQMNPRPPGMSGCAMWRIHQGGVPTAGWSTNDIRLVAIEHTHAITDRALVGTRVGVLVAMALKLDPTLAPVLDLGWPRRKRVSNERLVIDE